jgi:hypothetical protein
MGDVKLPGRSQRVPLWIARRLTDRPVWASFTEAIRRRPAPGLRIVLSLTPTHRLEKDIHRGHSIIALRDVALAADALILDPAILAARVGGGAAGIATAVAQAAPAIQALGTLAPAVAIAVIAAAVVGVLAWRLRRPV